MITLRIPKEYYESIYELPYLIFKNPAPRDKVINLKYQYAEYITAKQSLEQRIQLLTNSSNSKLSNILQALPKCLSANNNTMYIFESLIGLGYVYSHLNMNHKALYEVKRSLAQGGECIYNITSLIYYGNPVKLL